MFTTLWNLKRRGHIVCWKFLLIIGLEWCTSLDSSSMPKMKFDIFLITIKVSSHMAWTSNPMASSIFFVHALIIDPSSTINEYPSSPSSDGSHNFSLSWKGFVLKPSPTSNRERSDTFSCGSTLFSIFFLL